MKEFSARALTSKKKKKKFSLIGVPTTVPCGRGVKVLCSCDCVPKAYFLSAINIYLTQLNKCFDVKGNPPRLLYGFTRWYLPSNLGPKQAGLYHKEAFGN